MSVYWKEEVISVTTCYLFLILIRTEHNNNCQYCQTLSVSKSSMIRYLNALFLPSHSTIVTSTASDVQIQTSLVMLFSDYTIGREKGFDIKMITGIPSLKLQCINGDAGSNFILIQPQVMLANIIFIEVHLPMKLFNFLRVFF